MPFSKVITSKGIALQAKAQTGVELKYTRFVLGDGRLNGQVMSSLTNVISPKKTMPVTKLKMEVPNQATIGFMLSNQDVTTGFYFRELGLYANDPDEGEILYLYANAGDTAEYISAAGGSEIVEESFDVLTFVGQATNISAVIDSSLVYVSHAELEEALRNIDIDVIDSTTSTDTTKAGSANSVRQALTDAKKYADDNFIKPSQIQTPNLIKNSSGFFGLQGWTPTGESKDAWTVAGDISSIGGHIQNAASVPTGSGSYIDTDPIRVVAGNTYQLQAMFHTSGSTAGRVAVEIINVDKNASYGQIEATMNTWWHRKVGTIKIPDGVTQIRVRLTVAGVENTLVKGFSRVKFAFVHGGANDTPYSNEGDIRELFQSVSDGKAKLKETIVTEKGGTVSQAGSVPTFDELNAGIMSISSAPESFGSGTTVFNSTGDTVATNDNTTAPTRLLYKNFTLNEGHTFTLSGTMSGGLIIYVEGDCVINGILHMNQKASYAIHIPPAIISTRLPWFNASLMDVLDYSYASGGRGGNGGNGGSIRDATTYGIGGTGGTGSVGRIGAGGFGGGGGGGAASFTWYDHDSARKGGAGGSPLAAIGTCLDQTVSKYLSPGRTETILNIDGSSPPRGTGGGGSGGMSQGSSQRWGNAGSGGQCYGAGGGGGGGIAAVDGWGFNGGIGSYAGGCIILVVKGNLTIGPNGSIQAIGAAGGNGARGYASGGNACGGGGGGGAGGGVVAIYHKGTFTNNGSINVSGGQGGVFGEPSGTTYTTPATAGTAGGAGKIITRQL